MVRNLPTISRIKAISPLLILAIVAAGASSVQAADPVANQTWAAELPLVEQIVARMVAQGQWQKLALLEYRAMRRFQASNTRFKVESTLEVMTTFRQPDTLESWVLKQEGSNLIRQRVFDKILEEEKENQLKKERIQNDVLPANYHFEFAGNEDYKGRKSYQLSIVPKRKSKYLLRGSIWIDAEDFAISRIHGSPSKRVSFWTLRTEVDRQYERVGKFWLTKSIDSASDIFLAGHSTLSISSSYQKVQASMEIPVDPVN